MVADRLLLLKLSGLTPKTRRHRFWIKTAEVGHSDTEWECFISHII